MSLLCAALSVVLWGCPGNLEDPDRFLTGSTDSGTLQGFECPSAQLKVKEALIVRKCGNSGCHDQATSAGGLDLKTENLPVRMIDIPSTCPDKPLLSADGGGFFFEKLQPSPSCGGARMPLAAPPLTETEETCLREWANHVLDGGAE